MIRISIPLLLLALGFGSAQPFVLRTYDLTQLDARPGAITVSPDVLTLIEFADQVMDVSTARPDALTVEVSGNVIRLRANWRAGRTDLVVTVANQTAMFTVTIDPEGEHTRRYVVAKPTPPSPATSSALRLGGSLAPGQVSEPAPEWLSVSFNVLAVPGGERVIQYGLHNAGANELVNDALRLRLVQDGRTVPFTFERLSTGGTINRIKPGHAEYGTILVRDPRPGPLTLVWDLVEIGPGNSYTLLRVFHDGLVQPVR
jgi:hypothetical protein